MPVVSAILLNKKSEDTTSHVIQFILLLPNTNTSGEFKSSFPSNSTLNCVRFYACLRCVATGLFICLILSLHKFEVC